MKRVRSPPLGGSSSSIPLGLSSLSAELELPFSSVPSAASPAQHWLKHYLYNSSAITTAQAALASANNGRISIFQDSGDSNNWNFPVKGWVCLLSLLIRRFGRGFMVGYGMKIIVGLIGTILRTRSPSVLLSHLVKNLSSMDNIRYGAFLGAMLAFFEASMRILHRFNKLTLSHRAIISGGLSGLSMLFLPQDAHMGMSMFFLVRALETGANNLVSMKLVPSIPYSSTLLMAIASTPVIWCWLFKRDALDVSYLKFLDFQGAKGKPIQDTFAELHTGSGLSMKTLSRLNEFRIRNKLPVFNLKNSSLSCECLHPDTYSCTLASFKFWIAAFRRALPVYVPVYLIPLLLFRSRQLFSKMTGMRLLWSACSNVLRSSMFLSSYCTMCWTVADVLSQIATTRIPNNMLASNRVAHLSVPFFYTFLPGFCGGLMVIFEKESRRIELALYVLAQALPATYRSLRDSGLVPRLPHGEIFWFILSMSILLSSYAVRPQVLRSSYVSLFDFLFQKSAVKQLKESPDTSSDQ